jgi:hypothetical protein
MGTYSVEGEVFNLLSELYNMGSNPSQLSTGLT